eukprot:gnl/MRDRNA2_/MRDRNA2_91888_c0_seq1.p1 gnl/MRDRNA2_/MRDRNA2_91888_c0~~gnl/MRDRNA2_/MRDRNA2_91888_c0_seq1.p1  ORF type:complete len:328 (+),score=26.19 gnl/MRDRNA2_/MRDRNA2_91888_c0_seq1:131-1114(+)
MPGASPRHAFNPGIWAGQTYETSPLATDSTCGPQSSRRYSGSSRSSPSLRGSQTAPSLKSSQASSVKHSSNAKQSGSAQSKAASKQSPRQEASKHSPRETRSNASTKCSMISGSRYSSEVDDARSTLIHQLRTSARSTHYRCGSDVSLASYKNAGTEIKRVIFPKHEFTGEFTPRDAANLRQEQYYRSLRRCPVTGNKIDKTGRKLEEQIHEVPKPKPSTARQKELQAQVSLHNAYDYSPRPITGYNDSIKELKSPRKWEYGNGDLEMYAAPSTRKETEHPHMATFGGYYARTKIGNHFAGGYFQRQKLVGQKKRFSRNVRRGTNVI